MFTIPDKGEGQNDLQSILFQEYLDILVAGIAGSECVLSGGTVTEQGVPDMTVAIAKAAVLSNGLLKPTAAGNATIAPADAANPRIDLIVADSTGAIAVRAGAAHATPKPAARSANDVVLAAVYVPAGATAITAARITDLRIIRSKGPLGIGKVTSPVTFNSTNLIQTYFSLTIPAGLLTSGRMLGFACGGSYLSNSGTPTWTIAISFGGTVLFSDATAATAADVDRGAWNVEGRIAAQSDTQQTFTGHVRFQTPAAKTASAQGTGDLGVATSVNAPVRGSSAVDANAADRELTVQWTMSVADANVETVMDHAEAWLR